MFHMRSLSMKLWQMETISWCCHVHYFTSLVIWKGILCQHIFFPEALVILSQRRALGERKVCDKFPFPILDLSIKIEFLCSKCSCPCFMLESPCLPPPRSSRGGGGVCTPCTLPLDPPLYIFNWCDSGSQLTTTSLVSCRENWTT